MGSRIDGHLAVGALEDEGRVPFGRQRRGPAARRTVTVLLVLALAVGVAVWVGRDTPRALQWRLDMVEDFDRVADDRWSIADGWGAANEASWLQRDNVSVVDGALRVQALPEEAGGRSYTSGRLDTNGKYALPDTFRVEVRARVPYQQGLWAAPLWLRPVDGQMGEIDLVETYGAEREDPTVHQTIHSAYGVDHDYVSRRTRFAEIGDTAATDWHTYTVEKVPGSITMWVDGTRTARFTAEDAAWYDEYYEAGMAWNLRVNLQVGGSYGEPDAGTVWSGDAAVMQLDRIRTWVPG
ncbi:glycoside hydrolase family 16 protein [Nocardioides marmoraquaticus]